MSDPIQQNPVAAAVSNALSSPLPPDPQELARREAVKDELRRLIGVVDAGNFGALIVTEMVPNTYPAQWGTGMWGESDLVRGSAVQVARLYAQREEDARRGEAPAASESGLILPPEKKVIA